MRYRCVGCDSVDGTYGELFPLRPSDGSRCQTFTSAGLLPFGWRRRRFGCHSLAYRSGRLASTGDLPLRGRWGEVNRHIIRRSVGRVQYGYRLGFESSYEAFVSGVVIPKSCPLTLFLDLTMIKREASHQLNVSSKQTKFPHTSFFRFFLSPSALPNPSSDSLPTLFLPVPFTAAFDPVHPFLAPAPATSAPSVGPPDNRADTRLVVMYRYVCRRCRQVWVVYRYDSLVVAVRGRRLNSLSLLRMTEGNEIIPPFPPSFFSRLFWFVCCKMWRF